MNAVWATLSRYDVKNGCGAVTVDLSTRDCFDELARLALMLRSDTVVVICPSDMSFIGGWRFRFDAAGRALVAKYLRRKHGEVMAKIREDRASAKEVA